MMIAKTKFNGHGPDGRRLYRKGGGGSQVKYDSLETLYAEQADSARLLRQQAEANLPGAVQAYVGQVNNLTSPGYADRQAGLVASDMAAAGAMERAATERNLASLGVNPNDARFAGSLRSTELGNAARLAAGKNLARNDARRYQLAVAQDAVGTFTGQSNSAATQAGNASNGLASLYGQQQQAQMQQQANTQNAIGSAVGGGIAAYSMFMKDGGRVPGLVDLVKGKNVEYHAMGGMAGSQQKNQGFFQMQQIAPPPQAAAAPKADPVGQALGTANQMMALKRGADIARMGVPAQQTAAPVAEAAATPAGWAANPAPQAAAEAAAAEATGAAAAEAGGAAALEAGGTAALEAGGAAALEAGGTAGLQAGATGLAGAGGAAMAALPWVGAAYGVGKLLEWWGDGGEVGSQQDKIQDLRPGGKVPGKWAGAIDDVPAVLTKEEHVLNPEAAKLAGHDELERLNKKGLALRKKGKTPDKIKKVGLEALA